MTTHLPFWKSMLLHGWYYGTQPTRWWTRRRAAAAGRMPLSILFYHRVADRHPNAWTATTRTFRRHLDWLQGHCQLAGLEDVQRRIRSGRNARPIVSLTFDDGYADNCATAIPLLIERGIPCTYFVSVDHVLHGRPFPHDVAAGRPLAPNDLRQLRAMAEAGIEIGAHTATHADLGAVDETQLYEELVAAKVRLEDALGRGVRYFAFPYGLPANITPRALALARYAGYAAVCSAYGAYNLPGDDGFHLRRIHADDDLLRLKNWLTLDPRKLRRPAGWPETLPAAATPPDAPLIPDPFVSSNSH